MKKKEICLIGLGGIGFRHFQSLCDLGMDYRITAVDIDETAIERAAEYSHARGIAKVEQVRFLKEIKDVKDVDVAIVATTSIPRRRVFENLVNTAEVKNVIFEKFLFPNEIDYEIVKNLLDTKKIQAFVNTPGRLMPGYKDLKAKLDKSQHLDVFLCGSNWGLACNAIHFIDQVAYLLDTYDDIMVDYTQIDPKVIDSKRKGYVEFTGQLICQVGGANIVLRSEATGAADYSITIFKGESVYSISEVNQSLTITREGKSRVEDFPIIFQSKLTSSVVEDLIRNGSCGLSRYENSMKWHMSLLKAFEEVYRKNGKEVMGYCPIT